jgi:hypothetical protein
VVIRQTTAASCNSCILQQLHPATAVSCNSCILQQLYPATAVSCNSCILPKKGCYTAGNSCILPPPPAVGPAGAGRGGARVAARMTTPLRGRRPCRRRLCGGWAEPAFLMIRNSRIVRGAAGWAEPGPAALCVVLRCAPARWEGWDLTHVCSGGQRRGAAVGGAAPLSHVRPRCRTCGPAVARAYRDGVTAVVGWRDAAARRRCHAVTYAVTYAVTLCSDGVQSLGAVARLRRPHAGREAARGPLSEAAAARGLRRGDVASGVELSAA